MGKQVELERYGYQVVLANTGEKAVARVKDDPAIDLVLMDIDLGPGIDGTESAELILKDREIPIVFLSSHMEPEIVEKTEIITSYGYVVKSSNITVLDASIKMAFKLFDANMKIEESNEKQKTMLSNITDVISIIDAEGKVQYISPNIQKWFGWSTEEMTGSSGFQNIHPDDLQRAQAVFASVVRQHAAVKTINLKYRCADASYKPIELSCLNLMNDPAINGVLINYRDISQRIKYEDRNTANLNSLINNRQESIWSIDRDYNYIILNDFFKKAYYDVYATYLIKGTNALDALPADQLVLWKSMYDTALSGESVVFEFKNPKDQLYQVSLNPIITNNIVTGVTALSVDITEQRRIEELALESNEKYKLVFDNSMDGILFTAPDGSIISANTRACEILESSESALIEKGRGGVVDVNDPRLPGALSQREELGYFNGELSFLRGNGEVIPVELTSCIFLDREQRKRSYISFKELSEIKTKERELEKALEEKEYLMKEMNHRVKNNLFMVSSLLSMKNLSLGEQVDLSDIISQIDAITIIHEKLSYQSENIDQIDLADYIEELLSSVFSLNNAPVQVEQRVPKFLIDARSAIAIGLIVNELATNAVKHGFSNSSDPRFIIEFKQALSAEKRFVLTVSHTGDPFPDDIDFSNTQTLGLRLISALVEQLSGEFELKRRPHPEFTIRFPLERS